MQRISDFIINATSGSLRLLLLIASIAYGGYNFLMKCFDDKTEKLKSELYQVRDADKKLFEQELKSIQFEVRDGFKDLRESNKIIINSLLRINK